MLQLWGQALGESWVPALEESATWRSLHCIRGDQEVPAIKPQDWRKERAMRKVA